MHEMLEIKYGGSTKSRGIIDSQFNQVYDFGIARSVLTPGRGAFYDRNVSAAILPHSTTRTTTAVLNGATQITLGETGRRGRDLRSLFELKIIPPS